MTFQRHWCALMWNAVGHASYSICPRFYRTRPPKYMILGTMVIMMYMMIADDDEDCDDDDEGYYDDDDARWWRDYKAEAEERREVLSGIGIMRFQHPEREKWPGHSITWSIESRRRHTFFRKGPRTSGQKFKQTRRCTKKKKSLSKWRSVTFRIYDM